MSEYHPAGTEFTCQNCNETFSLSYGRTGAPKFCGNTCKGEASSTSITLACDECGEEMERQPSRVDEAEDHFCSTECRNAFAKGKVNYGRDPERERDETEKHYPAGSTFTCETCGDEFSIDYGRTGPARFCSQPCHYEGRKTSLTLTCETCGDAFERVPSQATLTGHHYCSEDCRGEAEHDQHEVTCVTCETTFTVPRHRLGTAIACSKPCQTTWQRGHMRGEGNPRYRDDIDDERLINLYEDGYTLREVAEKLDTNNVTVMERLHAAGAETRNPNSLGLVCETTTGQTVRSSYERRVAEYLHGTGIDYGYEPDNFPGPYTPDFVLEDGTVVEVWGMMEWDTYAQKRAEKEQWYAGHDHALVSIEPSDLSNLDEVFAHAL